MPATGAGMGLASGDLALAGRGLLRCGVDAGVILALSGILIAVKKAVLHAAGAGVTVGAGRR